MKAKLPPSARSRGALLSFLVPILLLALPLAVWLDLRNLSESSLRRQASDLNSVITGIRGYYASHIVGRVLASPAAQLRSNASSACAVRFLNGKSDTNRYAMLACCSLMTRPSSSESVAGIGMAPGTAE